jgi:thioredoxin 1
MDDVDKIRHKKMQKMLDDIKIVDVEDKTGTNNGKPKQLSDNDFNDFIQSKDAVLVDCWAEWCGPCRMLEPTINELASEYSGFVAVAKLNVDHNPVKANEYGISGIPTMLLFKNGRLVDRLVGLMPKQAIEAKLKAIM